MKLSGRNLVTILLVLAASALPACKKKDKQDTAQDWKNRDAGMREIKREMDKLDSEVKTMIKQNQCATSYDCDAIGYGPILCGKRYKYLIYSRKSSPASVVEQKVRRYNQLAVQFNKHSYKVMSCGVDKPSVACKNYRCVKVR